MSVSLRVGKWYRTRNGTRVLCAGYNSEDDVFVCEADGFELFYYSDGVEDQERYHLQIVAEAEAFNKVPSSDAEAWWKPGQAPATPTTRKESSMNSKRLVSSMFGGPVGKNTDANVRVAMTGGLAVRGRGDSNFVAFQNGGLVDVYDFAFDAQGLVYNMPVQSVAAGDLILTQSDDYLFVVKVNDDGTLIGLNPSNSRKEFYNPTASLLFGQNKFFIKVTSMFGDFGAGATAGGFNPMMLMLMDKDGGSLGDKLPLLMMSGAFGGATGGAGSFNPMMLMLMGDKGGESSGMMEAMLLSQAFGGANPFAPKA